MTVSYFVLYRGASADQARFVEHYRNVHVRILLTFPGIEGVVLHEPLPSADSEAVVDGGFALIAQMEFADPAALQTALASAERQHARRDMEANFPDFHGTIWHQATVSERRKNEH